MLQYSRGFVAVIAPHVVAFKRQSYDSPSIQSQRHHRLTTNSRQTHDKLTTNSRHRHCRFTTLPRQRHYRFTTDSPHYHDNHATDSPPSHHTLPDVPTATFPLWSRNIPTISTNLTINVKKTTS